MPKYALECLKCGHVDEQWYPSFSAADTGLAQWRCPKCGCPKKTKKPQVSFWQFGTRLKGIKY